MTYREKFTRPIEYIDRTAHDEDIERDDLPDDIEYFYELYRDSFQHHVVPHLLASSETLEVTKDASKKRLFQIDKLTAYFLTKVYKPTGISRTENTSQLDAARHAVNDYKNEFLERVSGSPISDDFKKTGNPGSNRLNFLIGDIGVGKSLLATKVCHDIRQQSLDESGYKVLSVYVDFESIMPHSDGEFDDINEYFYSRLYGLIITEGNRDAELKGALSIQVSSQLPPTQKIRELAIHLLNLTTPVRLFIAIDNIDRYHFFYSKYAFFDEYRAKQIHKISHNIDNLLTHFADSQFLGDCGLAILFVCRPGLLKTLSTRADVLNNKRRMFKDFEVFRLSPTSAADVIESRFILLRDAIKLLEEYQPRKFADYTEILQKMRDVFEKSLSSTASSQSSLRLVSDLCHQGTRSFVDFLGSIQLDLRDQYRLAHRLFIEQPHNLLRVYITNLKKKYAQEKGHFPNLFLADAVISPTENFRALAHKEHKHTYWLKYLLLKYICKQTEGNRKFVTFRQIQEIFSSLRDPIYEDHLVKLALGSLASTNTSNCIEIDEPATGDVIRIRPTKRGRKLIEVTDTSTTCEFCFDFDYLQFMIDDYDLSLPNPYLDNVYVDANLAYMFNASPAHSAGLREYLASKMLATIYFVRILEASAKAELRFRMVGADQIKPLFPEFDSIYRHLAVSYERILSHVNAGAVIDAKVREQTEKIRKDKNFDDFFVFYGMEFQPLVQPS